MAAGRPVICLDIGGPASQVTPEAGFVIPATNPKETVAAMASALGKLAGDRALLMSMSAKGRARVREKFTQRVMGAAMNAFYLEAVALHAASGSRTMGGYSNALPR
jgi:glycosyltransferase involved in cell wall biosynthesis